MVGSNSPGALVYDSPRFRLAQTHTLGFGSCDASIGAGVFGVGKPVVVSLIIHSTPHASPNEFCILPPLKRLVTHGKKSLLSPEYMITASPICFSLLKQLIASALSFALLSAGSSMAARMAMMAMTTSNSIRVKPRAGFVWLTVCMVIFSIKSRGGSDFLRRSRHLSVIYLRMTQAEEHCRICWIYGYVGRGDTGAV